MQLHFADISSYHFHILNILEIIYCTLTDTQVVCFGNQKFSIIFFHVTIYFKVVSHLDNGILIESS